MKKAQIFFLSTITLFGLFACKKDYVCNCSVTYYSQVGSVNVGSANTNIVITMKSVSKKTAKRNCISGKIQQSNTQDYIINECKLN